MEVEEARMEPVQPRELATGARVAEALVYAVGVAGVLAGGLLFQQDQIGFAIVALALTFVAGVALRLAAWAARALAILLIRTERMDEELTRLGGKGPTDSGWH
jgi:hypothetical protein